MASLIKQEVPRDPYLPIPDCAQCGRTPTTDTYVQCLECRSPNGDEFIYCGPCADFRLACITHQANLGTEHMFKRMVNKPGIGPTCNNCGRNVKSEWHMTCLPCGERETWDLCYQCLRKVEHQHLISAVNNIGEIIDTHIEKPPEHVVKRAVSAQNWICCDGIACEKRKREVRHEMFLRCTTCILGPHKNPFDLCVKCADEDHGAYLHTIHTPGNEPHIFGMVDGRE